MASIKSIENELFFGTDKQNTLKIIGHRNEFTIKLIYAATFCKINRLFPLYMLNPMKHKYKITRNLNVG